MHPLIKAARIGAVTASYTPANTVLTVSCHVTVSWFIIYVAGSGSMRYSVGMSWVRFI